MVFLSPFRQSISKYVTITPTALPVLSLSSCYLVLYFGLLTMPLNDLQIDNATLLNQCTELINIFLSKEVKIIFVTKYSYMCYLKMYRDSVNSHECKLISVQPLWLVMKQVRSMTFLKLKTNSTDHIDSPFSNSML
jgi:hypothetical protein